MSTSMDEDGMHNLPWDLIRAFLALDRHGDYAIAAEMEHIDDSTLRRRIRTLEQRMGRTLFVRTERGWKAAPDQLELVDSALRMEDAARAFSNSCQDSTGVVSISLLDACAELFSEAFCAFQRKFPRIVLNITTESHFVDLEKEQVDIAIRLARPLRNGSSLRIRKIGDLDINAYASEAYLARLAARGQPAESASHDLLAMNLGFPSGDHNFAYRELTWDELGLRGRVVSRSDSMLMLARMCELGLGVALMPSVIAADHPCLRPVLANRPDARGDLWMISRFDLRAAWQRELADMLKAALASRQARSART